jgi:lipoprotein-releasing system ATP-binding protein
LADIVAKVEHLRKSFTDDEGVVDVLKDVCFTVNRGEMVALVGISGAGKTTLLQILGGLDNFNEGSVSVLGLDLKVMAAKKLAAFRNQHIGFVFQFHHLLPDFTALENTMIPGLIAGKSAGACKKRGIELLDIFGLAARKSHFPTELSGGERQRVALARALFNDPAFVLADEPTGNLDKKNGEYLLEYFKKANKELNQTFIIATHNAQLTNGLNRALFLEDGVMAKDKCDNFTVTE